MSEILTRTPDELAAAHHREALTIAGRAAREEVEEETGIASESWLAAAEHEARAAELSSHGGVRARYLESAASFALRAGASEQARLWMTAAAASLAADVPPGSAGARRGPRS